MPEFLVEDFDQDVDAILYGQQLLQQRAAQSTVSVIRGATALTTLRH